MLSERQWESGKVVCVAMWTVVAVLLAGAWVVFFFQPTSRFGIPLAASAGCASALAGVLHLRMYAVRMCSLIRVTAGLQREPERPHVPLQTIR